MFVLQEISHKIGSGNGETVAGAAGVKRRAAGIATTITTAISIAGIFARLVHIRARPLHKLRGNRQREYC